MTAGISEAQARKVLADVGSPAADPAKYTAHRISDGWLFGWNPTAGAALLGAAEWVVADNGKCADKRFTMRAEDAIRSLMHTDN